MIRAEPYIDRALAARRIAGMPLPALLLSTGAMHGPEETTMPLDFAPTVPPEEIAAAHACSEFGHDDDERPGEGGLIAAGVAAVVCVGLCALAAIGAGALFAALTQ